MALFSFGKKVKSVTVKVEPEMKSACCGGGDCGKITESRFIVLGACCDRSRTTFANARQAVKEMGFEDEVVNIGDALEIAKYGVMQTPALVVDGKVVASGRLLKVEDVKEIFAKLEVKCYGRK